MVVRNDIKMMQRKLDGGDIGSGDKVRTQKLVAICRDYLLTPPKPGYRIPASLHQAGIIPRKYLQSKIQGSPAFDSFKLGANAALDITIKDCEANGYFREVERSKIMADHAYQGKCYLIGALP
jgi:hypothetical protein